MKEGWEYKKLGAVADFYRGLTYKREDEVDSSENCVLRSNNIDLESMSLNFEELKYIRPDFVIPEDKKLKANSVFVCMSNGSKQHVGKVAYVNEDMNYAFGGFMGLIVPKPQAIGKYIYYVCRSSLFRYFLEQIGNGIGITNLRFSDLNEFSIPFSPLSQQQHIVEELDLLSSIIEKKKAQLKELDNLAQSLFYEMFGNPTSSERGWVVKNMNEVCSLKSGNSNANNSAVGDLPYVKVGDMNLEGNESFIIKSSNYVDRKSNLKNIFPSGTTIFPKRGGAILTNKKRLTKLDVCCDLNVMGVIPNKTLIHPLFLFYYFLRIDFSVFANNGSTIPQINNYDIAPMDIIVPPMDLQIEFIKKIEAIEYQKELIKNSIKEVKTLYNSRMDFWFN